MYSAEQYSAVMYSLVQFLSKTAQLTAAMCTEICNNASTPGSLVCQVILTFKESKTSIN